MNVLSLCGQEVGLSKNPSVSNQFSDFINLQILIFDLWNVECDST